VAFLLATPNVPPSGGGTFGTKRDKNRKLPVCSWLRLRGTWVFEICTFSSTQFQHLGLFFCSSYRKYP
jgi:hypothetical protein